MLNFAYHITRLESNKKELKDPMNEINQILAEKVKLKKSQD